MLNIIEILFLVFGWIYKFDDLIEVLNANSTIKVGKTWKIVIKYILPICILGLWIQGVVSTINEADTLSSIVMLILTIVVIVVPCIIALLPARNKNYYDA